MNRIIINSLSAWRSSSAKCHSRMVFQKQRDLKYFHKNYNVKQTFLTSIQTNNNNNNSKINNCIFSNNNNNNNGTCFRYFTSASAAEQVEEISVDESNNTWTPESRRTGALALKVGMVAIFDEWGKRWPCTVLYLDNCKVIQVKTPEKEGISSIQVGIGHKKLKKTTLPLKGHFDKAKVDPRRKLCEFRVTDDALVPVGTEISARHFVPGQYVDIIGTSIGKGFQGVMKRYGFKGQRATHGVSKTHRQMGSTGQSQGPGRVFKNKKMPGRMGGKQVTQQCLIVHQIDPVKNLIYVRGSIPGHKGNYVKIQDTKKNWGKRAFKEAPPFPTFISSEDENIDELDMIVVEPPEEDFFGYR